MIDLSDKTVVVTGAGRGLGRALVDAFRAAGARVAAVVRNERSAEELRQQADDERFRVYVADVGDAAAVADAFDAVRQQLGRIDVLFNNAAVYPRVSFLEETAEDWARAIAVNVNGMAYCCKAALPGMIEQRWGRIYNVGSWADGGPIPSSAAYSSSKGAVHALTRAVAADLACLELDVQVHEWIPGHLNTRMSEFTGIDPSVSAGWAVAMVRADAATGKCRIFENDREWVPPRRLKDRLLDKLRFWR